MSIQNAIGEIRAGAQRGQGYLDSGLGDYKKYMNPLMEQGDDARGWMATSAGLNGYGKQAEQYNAWKQNNPQLQAAYGMADKQAKAMGAKYGFNMGGRGVLTGTQLGFQAEQGLWNDQRDQMERFYSQGVGARQGIAGTSWERGREGAGVETQASNAIAQAYIAQAQMEAQAKMAKQQQKGQMLGSLIGMGTKLLGGFMSDRRLKTDIVSVGADENGVNWYDWRYLWDEPGTRRRGVMAQEVMHIPGAVFSVGDWLAVDYGAL